MRLKDCMSTSVETVNPEMPAQAAWERMQQRRIRHLVVMKDRKVAGVVSERDLGGNRGATLRSGKTVGELMTPFVVSLTPEATVLMELVLVAEVSENYHRLRKAG